MPNILIKITEMCVKKNKKYHKQRCALLLLFYCIMINIIMMQGNEKAPFPTNDPWGTL